MIEILNNLVLRSLIERPGITAFLPGGLSGHAGNLHEEMTVWQKSASATRRKFFCYEYSFHGIFLMVLMLMISLAALASSPKDPSWTGKGHYRILVKAPPFQLQNSLSSDEMPAKY